MIPLFWRILATLLLPVVVLRLLVDRGFRNGLAERTGGGGWSKLRGKGRPDSIWFHAASMGEVIGIFPVISRVRTVLPNTQIVVTTTSISGRSEALRRGVADFVLLLPIDHPLFISRALGDWRPRYFVVTETELWPNLLLKFGKEGVSCFLVNARISDRSFDRYCSFTDLFSPVVKVFSKIFAQTELDAERFKKIGVLENKITVLGSTKYDQLSSLLSEEQIGELAAGIGISREKPCFVAGSVRHGEEELVISAYLQARSSIPDLQFIIAPRHPERFLMAAEMLKSHRLPFVKRSSRVPAKGEVVLLDSLGELANVYSLATVAFVGGTLVNAGGHNPLEPAAYGCATIVGPNTENFREAINALKGAKGIVIVENSIALGKAIVELIEKPEYRLLVGASGQSIWQKNQGATNALLRELNLLQMSPSPQVAHG